MKMRSAMRNHCTCHLEHILHMYGLARRMLETGVSTSWGRHDHYVIAIGAQEMTGTKRTHLNGAR
jgi:hypothetical protein